MIPRLEGSGRIPSGRMLSLCRDREATAQRPPNSSAWRPRAALPPHSGDGRRSSSSSTLYSTLIRSLPSSPTTSPPSDPKVRAASASSTTTSISSPSVLDDDHAAIRSEDLKGSCMVIGSIHSTEAKEGKVCPLFRVAGKKYMTCPSTGRKQLEPACNCCHAGEKGCIMYFRNGNVARCPRE